LIWPDRVKEPRVVSTPCSTSDYLPTLVDLLDLPLPNRPYDGISLLPLINGETSERAKPLHFEHPNTMKQAFVKENPDNQTAMIDNRYKIISVDGEKSYQLYDLEKDLEERNDLSQKHPEIVSRMKEDLEKWRQSCRESAAGKDYPKP